MHVSSYFLLAYKLHTRSAGVHGELFAVQEASGPCKLGWTGEVPVSFAKSTGEETNYVKMYEI